MFLFVEYSEKSNNQQKLKICSRKNINILGLNYYLSSWDWQSLLSLLKTEFCAVVKASEHKDLFSNSQPATIE